jgi:hypothetical protein
VIAPKVTSYVTPTRREAPPTTTRIITRVPTADEAREILRGDARRSLFDQYMDDVRAYEGASDGATRRAAWDWDASNGTPDEDGESHDA